MPLASGDIPPTLLLRCDRRQVVSAVTNLVDNAVKYAKAGEIAVRARTDEHGRLELTVSDQGPGLAPELAQRIFERFERGHRADQARGFGGDVALLSERDAHGRREQRGRVVDAVADE